MEPDSKVLGVYADALTTVIKNHQLTSISMDLIRKRFRQFADLLSSRVNGIDIIHVGSSYDDLHLMRILENSQGKPRFFPEGDFDFDMVYLNYVVGEDHTQTTVPSEESDDTKLVTGTNVKDEVVQTPSERESNHESKTAANDVSALDCPAQLNIAGHGPDSSRPTAHVETSSSVRDAGVSAPERLPDTGSRSMESFAIMEATPNHGYVKLRVTKHGRKMLQKTGCVVGNFITSDGYLLNTAFSAGIVTGDKGTEIIYSRTGDLTRSRQGQDTTTCTDTPTSRDTSSAFCLDVPSIYILSGPAITAIQHASDGYTYDFVHAFPCPVWPSITKGWMGRARKCRWPNESLIEEIPKDGCLVVPVGSHESCDPTKEWRLSFVKAECALSDSLTGLQRTCYSVVKVMLKSLLSEQAILTSYHMKNIFFYLCEEVASEGGSWTLDNLGDKMMQFLEYIVISLHIHRIPQYFLPPLNLIGHCSKEDVEATKKDVEEIKRKPFTALMEACRKLECFDVISASQKFQSFPGEMKPMLVVYTAIVQILWKLGCMNIGEDIATVCFQKVVQTNTVSSNYIKTGSHTFTASSIPALLKPLAIAHMQESNVNEALWLFHAIEENDPDLVMQSYTDVFTNIACMYSLKSSQCQNKCEQQLEYKEKAMVYFRKALSLIHDSPSLHLMYGNFLMDHDMSIAKAAEQFQKAVAIENPRQDDDALLQIDVPGDDQSPSQPCYVPGKVAAYYLLIQCWVKLMDIFHARRAAMHFEEFIGHGCALKHKRVACQLCGFSYALVGLDIKSSLMFKDMSKY